MPSDDEGDGSPGRSWTVGIVGTFDVQNYGDLLFPLIAQTQLAQRLGAVRILAFSYHRRVRPTWPYEVHSVTDLPAMIGRLDALLIGGGFIVRFDKDVAPGYAPPDERVHHPTGYWLTPALLAVQHDVPLVWNAPGMHCNEIPGWAAPLLRIALDSSRYVAVRDAPTQCALRDMTDATVEVVPDTGFGVGSLLHGPACAESVRVREALDIRGPYILVQAATSSERFVRFVRDNAVAFHDRQFLAVQIAPALGESGSIVADLPNVHIVTGWPEPLVMAELIAHADAVVGHSYHLAITATVAGVPVFTPTTMTAGKYSALADIPTIHPMFDSNDPSFEWFASRVGRTSSPSLTAGLLERLDAHWDRTVNIIRAGPSPTHDSTDRFWQALPGRLEANAAAIADLDAERVRQSAAVAALDAAATEQTANVDELRSDLARHAVAAEAVQQRADRGRATLLALERHAISQGETIQSLEAQVVSAMARVQHLEAAMDDREQTIAALVAERTARTTSTPRNAELLRVLAIAAAVVADREDVVAALHESHSWKVTAPMRRASGIVRGGPCASDVMTLRRLWGATLATQPYEWTFVDRLFHPAVAAQLVDTFPTDSFAPVHATGGEKDYAYCARELVPMGSTTCSRSGELSDVWLRLAAQLASPAYRNAMSVLTRCDLSNAPLEVNVFRYGPQALLGPHPDLPDKVATHVAYFNRTWDVRDGGCLTILGSSAADDVVAELAPIVGNSAVLVRSDDSWHAVSPVVSSAHEERCSLTATFYRPGSQSSLWPR